jgi:hypothetical protein
MTIGWFVRCTTSSPAWLNSVWRHLELGGGTSTAMGSRALASALPLLSDNLQRHRAASVA